MGGNTGNERWVSFAGNEKEVWKCVALARSLRRGLTTRPLVIILSSKVGYRIRMLLEEEVDRIYVVEQNFERVIQFRSFAKLKAQELFGRKQIRWIFLDCNCLPIKNCDKLFRLNGVQWMWSKENEHPFAAIVVNSASVRDLARYTQTVVDLENPGQGESLTGKAIALKKLKYCYKIDAEDAHPCPLIGQNLEMVCFVGGHPYDNLDLFRSKHIGLLERDAIEFCLSLIPEKFPNPLKVDNCPTSNIRSELNNSIAIVGMSCRYPGANSIQEFWTLLEQGLEGIRKVPDARWTQGNSFIRMENVRSTEAGFLSCPIDTFDAKFFNTNLADMHFLDPQQRLSLRVVWEALEDAGIDPNSLKNSLTGVFGGWWRNDYKEMLQMQGFVDTDFLRGYMGNALGPLTARISHFFELIGPSFSTESGCSTSIAGVDMACDSLRNESCDIGIAVGANLLLHPFALGVMEGVLALDGRCKTFDAAGDGFGRAEGIGVLILKRLSNAVADGDRIWGVIRSSAVVQEGTSRSMGTPTVNVEAKAMQLALERAGVNPDDVDFVETHGTGTPVGDPIEIAAIAKSYSGRSKPLTIGSVKTNIGHTESVCGIASIHKTVLAMHNELIPKHLNFNQLNPEIDLSLIPAQLPLQAIPWKKRSESQRIAGINSFGITGAQAHLILEEPPKQVPPPVLTSTDSRQLKILTFSAKTETALSSLIESYSTLLKQPDSNISLQDMEFSMHTGRPHFGLRNVAMGSTPEELLISMSSCNKGTLIPNTPPRLCFLFTGQGSQYPGMAKSLYEDSVVFQSNFDWCDSVLQLEHGFSLKQALWSTEHAHLLKSTLYSQTSIFVVELCLLRLWESWGIVPDAVMGHSLGEFTAAVAAGMLTPIDALKLVVTRSKLIDALPKASMLVVASNLDSVQLQMSRAFANTKKWLDVAATNSGSQTVLAGSTDLIQDFKSFCDNNGIKTHILDASHAFHSKLMDPILEEYSSVASNMKFQEATKCTFISGVKGVQVTQVDTDYWIRHTRDKVSFLDACNTAGKEGLSFFVEVGPHPVLSALLLTNLDEIADDICTAPSLRKNASDWETMLSSLGKLYTNGIPLNWRNFHRYSGGKKMDLPGYHFEETSHWIAIKDDGTLPFHPLLGGFVPNPSDVTIFKNDINVHRLPFLKDHALGDKIIFPCAGYVDMCMTAGYAAIQCDNGAFKKPTNPLCIRNFAIHTPVCLSEMSPTEFQVVVNKSQSGEIVTTIFTKLLLEDGMSKWVRNASATFSTTHPSPSDPGLRDFAAIKERCKEDIVDNLFEYDKLIPFGFNFGPSLRVVETGWKNNVEGSDESLFKFQTRETNENLDRFIIHPWLVDPMLQTLITALGYLDLDDSKKRLTVPVEIDSFTWWGNSDIGNGTCYVYLKYGPTSACEAHLFNEAGDLLASMIGTEFMETTLANILSIIDSHRNPYPTLAEYGWKQWLGPEEKRISNEEREAICLKHYADPTEPYNQFTPDEAEFYKNFNKLAGFYMVKAVVELGLGKLNTVWDWSEICEKFGIRSSLSKFLRSIFKQLEIDGWLAESDNGCFRLQRQLPSQVSIQEQINSLLSSMLEKGVGFVDLSWVDPIWGVLSQILTGKVDALPILYPEDGRPGPAQLYYTETIFAKKRFALNAVEEDILSCLASLGTKTVVRILECGAGVGSTTSHLIRNMQQIGASHFEFTYTDLSPLFLQKGEQLFTDTGIPAKFGILNLENDPFSQGFIPAHYDVIVASWVLHATRSVEESLLNIRKLLKPGGIVLITDLVTPDRGANLSFGGLEGFWRFEDTHIRPWNCELSIEGWKTLFEKCGFQDFTSLQSYAGSNALLVGKLQSFDDHDMATIEMETPLKSNYEDNWIMFSDESPNSHQLIQRLEENKMSVQSVTWEQRKEITTILKTAFTRDKKPVGVIFMWGLIDDSAIQEVSEPFFHVCQYLAKHQGSLRLVTVTKGNLCTGPTDFWQSPPHASPLIGMTNVLANENPDIYCKCVDIQSSGTSSAVGEIFAELFSTDEDVMVAYRNGARSTPRLRPYKVKNNSLPIPSTSHHRLLLPASHMISDLSFVPYDPQPVGEGEVEIQVKAYALNFLDVLMVTKPDPVFERFNSVGVDIAGVVTKVGANCQRKIGDRIVMIRKSGYAMPTHLVALAINTMPIPDEITMAEAATLPMAVFTVASCLVDVAKAKEDDIVLIHTASGGVGLFAIQAAQHLGCTIVVTAGTKRKRNYLRSLGLKHVFNSRNTDYEVDVRAALGGRGVTIVLNSLTGVGYKEASLRLCEEGARFVEMSKMNIWSVEEVKQLRPDVEYSVVDISILPDEDWSNHLENLRAHLFGETDFKPKPLPYIRFDSSEIREALDYMEKVRHVGKLVLTMSEGHNDGVPNFPLFNSCSTYLITGGLGGIGLEVAKWMASSGARTLLLIGRNPPKLEALEEIKKLRETGIEVIVEQCDIGNFDDVSQLFAHAAETMPPIRGIMHAAGLLDDGTWENQTWEKYQNAFHPKVNGAWNLHQLSFHLHYPLEHFVLFSSMAVTLGAVAQSNYVAANQYLDSLAHYRYSQGLPATTINWGQWGQVGLAANIAHPIFRPFSVRQGIAALDHALRSRKTQIAAYEADLQTAKHVLYSTRGLLAEIEESNSSTMNEIDGEGFWTEYDVAKNIMERMETMKKFLKTIIRITLKMNKTEEIGDHVNFQDLGMDSLMMVEMKNGLQASVGKRVKISINSVKDCKTVAELTERLIELISGKEDLVPPTREQLKELVARDAILSEDIQVNDTLKSTLVPLSQVGCVLLLGATGTLGTYVLRELVRMSSINKIICLLKHDPNVSPLERFTKILTNKKLLADIPMDKVELVTGDIRQPDLGMESSIYKKLSTEVEAIFNIAAKIEMQEVYRESDDPKSSRVVNVFGMRNIIKFAVQTQLKYIFHSSTVATEIRLGDNQKLVESWADECILDLLPNSAYAISKLVCDRLAEQAVERGIPCKVFRFPQIGGDSVTGENMQMDSFLMTRLFAYMYLGIMIANNIPLSILPVDLAAKFSVSLFFNPDAGYEMFNVINPHLGDEREFEDMAAEFGVEVEPVDFDEFMQRVDKMHEDANMNDDMIELVKFGTSYEVELHSLEDNELPLYMSWIRGNKHIYWSDKLERLLPLEYPGTIPDSLEILRQTMQQAKKSGFFERYKIKETLSSSTSPIPAKP